MTRPSALDRITAVGPDECRAIRNVPNTLPVLETHFPRFPVLPGVLILETVVELAGQLAGPGWSLARAGRLRFRRFVRPGDQMHVTVRVVERSPGAVAVRAEVTVDDRVVMTAGRVELRPGAAA